MSEKNKQFGITVAIVLGAFAFVTFVAALYEGKIPIPEMFTNQFWVVLTGILIGIGGAATARLSNRNADRTQQVMRDSTVRVEKAVHDAKNEIQYEFYNGGAKNIAQQAAQETKTEVVSALAPLVLGGERRTEDEASDTGARRRAGGLVTQAERDALSLALQRTINKTLRRYGMKSVEIKIAYDHKFGAIVPYHSLEVQFREVEERD